MYNNNPFPNLDGFDPYFILGLNQDNPTVDDIKKAYRKAALNTHPDKNRDDPKATDYFKKVGAAYELLKDADKRAQYDEWKTSQALKDSKPVTPPNSSYFEDYVKQQQARHAQFFVFCEQLNKNPNAMVELWNTNLFPNEFKEHDYYLELFKRSEITAKTFLRDPRWIAEVSFETIMEGLIISNDAKNYREAFAYVIEHHPKKLDSPLINYFFEKLRKSSWDSVAAGDQYWLGAWLNEPFNKMSQDELKKSLAYFMDFNQQSDAAGWNRPIALLVQLARNSESIAKFLLANTEWIKALLSEVTLTKEDRGNYFAKIFCGADREHHGYQAMDYLIDNHFHLIDADLIRGVLAGTVLRLFGEFGLNHEYNWLDKAKVSIYDYADSEIQNVPRDQIGSYHGLSQAPLKRMEMKPISEKITEQLEQYWQKDRRVVLRLCQFSNSLKMACEPLIAKSLNLVRAEMVTAIAEVYKIKELEFDLFNNNPSTYLYDSSSIHFPEQSAIEELKTQIAKFRGEFSLFYEARDFATVVRLQYDELQAITDSLQTLFVTQQRKIVESAAVVPKPVDPDELDYREDDDEGEEIKQELQQKVDERLKTLKDGFVGAAIDYINLNRQNRSRFWPNWHSELGVERADKFVEKVNNTTNEAELKKVLSDTQAEKHHWFFSWPSKNSLQPMIAEKQKSLLPS